MYWILNIAHRENTRNFAFFTHFIFRSEVAIGQWHWQHKRVLQLPFGKQLVLKVLVFCDLFWELCVWWCQLFFGMAFEKDFQNVYFKTFYRRFFKKTARAIYVKDVCKLMWFYSSKINVEINVTPKNIFKKIRVLKKITLFGPKKTLEILCVWLDFSTFS